jgi:hypothetical protein
MVARGRPPRFGVPDVELLPGDGGRTMLDYLMEQRR